MIYTNVGFVIAVLRFKPTPPSLMTDGPHSPRNNGPQLAFYLFAFGSSFYPVIDAISYQFLTGLFPIFAGCLTLVFLVPLGFQLIGGAFIIIIALTPIVEPKAVIPLIAVFAVFNNVSRVFIYRKTIHWRLAIRFTLASLTGVYVGRRYLPSFLSAPC